MIEAPWTKEQVDALNAFQTEGLVHPFTCPHHSDRALVATEQGWVCRHCDYTQTWAHACMAQRHPLTHGRDEPEESGTDASERTSGPRKGLEAGSTLKPNG